ncbi:MAG: helicase-related protein [Armatimonadota bacterium]|nr:helicase-related protein [Armatimonadota bacterium]
MELREGQIVTGPFFSEPMRIVTAKPAGDGTWVVGLVGLQTSRFREVPLGPSELSLLHVNEAEYSYDGDGSLLRLGLQSHALGIAYEFDPYFGLSISRVDPLPHQLEAVYDYLLKLASVKFLLADDAGAGKTIMAGLLVKELKLRGLADRILIVCPANLTFQWQRELTEKFDEKFRVCAGSDVKNQFGLNEWMETPQIITSLDLAKRDDILPGLRQCRWNLVIVDEAHRMSAASHDKKSLRYKLGELLRDRTDNMLLLTATPHKGDPENFTLFLRLLDEDAFADVRSIRQAMDNRRAPFYLRRTKEAMVYFPELQPDGTWATKKIFTKRIPHTVAFGIDGAEFRLYTDVTRFVKKQSAAAAARGNDRAARAVGFLMTLYQRRLASSAYAIQRSLENRARKLQENLKKAKELADTAPPDIPDPEEMEEMEDSEREQIESILNAITITRSPELITQETDELLGLASQAEKVKLAGEEAKLSRLKSLLTDEGFFNEPGKRLLIFTEFKDTLHYLAGKGAGVVGKLEEWGFKVGVIHGGMRPGSRDDPGTRLYTEQQFKDGAIQILVATEAAGEGINLQCCHIMFNYDIPWNPNRLEQRMGRIHRYGQTQDCLIFNFVAANTVEGAVLNKLLDKLQEIRDALDDDAVFNVVGEVLPSSQIHRIFRDYYAGKLGDADLEEEILGPNQVERYRSVCQSALEGLASKRLNLAMLVERRALAKERRLVPETIARFLKDASAYVPMTLRSASSSSHTFDGITTPPVLRRYSEDPGWKLAAVASRYPPFSTDRKAAEDAKLEWVTPGHPLFEAIRRHVAAGSQECFAQGACFYSLDHDKPARLDFFRAQVVDGLGHVIHERLFVVEMAEEGEPCLREPGILGNMQPAPPSHAQDVIDGIGAEAWLRERALTPFLEEVRQERVAEVERIAEHVELSLGELIQREDELIGRFSEAAERGDDGAAGNLKQAEDRQTDVIHRRDRRRRELERQRSLLLQSVERITSVMILPHPDRDRPDVRNLKPDPETEAIAMRVAAEYEEAAGRTVTDVHEKNLGYDLTSLDTSTGDLRLIEVKGIAAETGTVCLSPNEKRVAEDRPDCYWLYVVTNCKTEPRLQEPVFDPARLGWREVSKVHHYQLSVSAMGKAMTLHEPRGSYGKGQEK